MGKWLSIEQYKKTYRFIGRESAYLLVAGMFAGVALSVVEVTFAYVLQAFLVIMKIVPSSASMNFPSWLPVKSPWSFFLFVSIVLFARGTIRWIHAYLNNAVVKVQSTHQRKRLIEWAFSARSINTGEFVTLYNNSSDSVAATLVNFQNIAVILTTAMLIFFYLLKISFLVTSVSIGILGVLALVMRGLDVQVTDIGRIGTLLDDQINRSLMLNIKNLLLLQIYGTQNKEKVQALSKLEQANNVALKYYRILNLKGALPQTLGVILICGLSVVSTQRSWIPSGLMITYFYLFLQFVNNFSDVIKLISTISFSIPATALFAKWWADHSYDGIRNRFDPNPRLSTKPLQESIGWNFSNVSFTYPNTDHLVLKDFSLSVPTNTCTVLLGESGSGKSTILSLALGLYQPTAGNITVSAADQRTKPLMEVQADLLQSVGYVGPESFLIEGTIRENLLYGLTVTPNEQEILHALEAAECLFVEHLSNKLNHHISEQGQGLSAGQKQRLAFARALLRKPKVLILDEATSNLDAETEEKLVATLSKLKGSMTILAVTHREALLQIADQTIRLTPLHA